PAAPGRFRRSPRKGGRAGRDDLRPSRTGEETVRRKMLPPIPLEDPSRRPAILARPSEHDRDDHDRDARVKEHVADRDHGADRRRDPDYIAESGQGITR